jgi:molybdopterin-synthase adenylyltransferase
MRYNRQELVIGKENQDLLQSKTVAIIGIGALGTVASQLLARAGINLILIDRDIIELSNLQRQLLFTEEDIGKSKALTAKKHLTKINSTIEITQHTIHLNQNNINILKKADLILDCTDNLQTRFLINNYCKQTSKTWIYSAAIKNHGYVMPITKEGPCINCFVQPAQLETCNTAGVLNTITTSIASLQVDIAIKILTNQEITSYLYYYNHNELKKLKVNKKENCQGCQGKYEIKENTSQFCSGRYQILGKQINIKEISQQLQKIDKVVMNEETVEFKNILLFKDGRALIKAKSLEQAQADYSKWVGN